MRVHITPKACPFARSATSLGASPHLCEAHHLHKVQHRSFVPHRAAMMFSRSCVATFRSEMMLTFGQMMLCLAAQMKKSKPIEHHSKGQFGEIRHISKEVCRILHLWTQMQCLSGKLISHRRTKKAPLCKGSSRRSRVRDCFVEKYYFYTPSVLPRKPPPLTQGRHFLPPGR